MPDKRREDEKRRRDDEKRRREAALANTAEVEEGGYEVPGRSIKQMVSVRLEAQLLKEIRQLAELQGVSISDILRQAAVDLVEHRRMMTGGLVMLRRAGGPQVIRNESNTAVTFAVPNAAEDPQIPVSGSNASLVLTH
ncbi:ribbon-helix-helix domain-containing protein [Mycobacterium sp. E2238]|uniref:ribbon-helix-helix domain-containing protein n=1 Tax=Mycobacterium sp. E2238 TaxID=1834131 RepID=UPI0009EDEB4C|nr:ribbon-helix-helix domain-containing protein [Mycobacterium sp. E2238]